MRPIIERLKRSLVGDILLLAVVLLGVAWWVGTDVSYVSDEQAAILQAQQLDAGEGWLTPNPLPSIDPEARWFYVVLSDQGPKGLAFYAKHPAYPLLLVALGRLGGTTAMVLSSVAGTLAAAGVTAALARRIDPRLTRWAFWSAGVASPLFFHSQLVIAHSLAAALVGGALVVARPWERPSGWLGWRVPLATLLLAGACLLRTEALFLALVMAGWAVLRLLRDRVRVWLVPAVLWGAVGPAALMVDRRLLAGIVGSGSLTAAGATGDDLAAFVRSRFTAGFAMLIGPGDGWTPSERLALLGGLLATVAFGLLLRRGRPSAVALLVAAGAAVAAGVLVLVQPGADSVRGILIACPVITVGLTVWRKVLFDRRPVWSLAVITLAFTAAVAATQYSTGGGLEWGARYLAIVLPAAIPLAVASVHRAVTGLAAPARKASVVSLTAMSLSMAVLGVATLKHTHETIRSLIAGLDWAAGEAAGPDLGDGDRRPVVLTTMFSIGRLTLGPGPDVRGLSVESGPGVEEVARRLHDAGVDEFVLVSEIPADIDLLKPWYRIRDTWEDDGRVLVMEAT